MRNFLLSLGTTALIALALASPLAASAQSLACGSCHGIPPSSGQHSTHKSAGVSCGTCHGSGYSTTTVNSATHQNGVRNVASGIGWNATSRSCSNSCHGSHSWGAAGTVTVPPPPPTTTTDGAALYASDCAGCHGALASSAKKGRTAAQIQAAINANTGGMGSLSSLTSTQVQAIATALAGTTTPPPPPPPSTDGAALYGSNCAGCHGALATSSKKGRTAAQIQGAINNNSGGMGSLSSLTSAQVQAIATALAGTTTTPPPPSTDGAALYTANCQSCHGALASSSKRGRSATQIRNAIASNTGGMGSLSSLTSAQITAIATVLADTGTTPPPTPTSCTTCHAAPPATGQHAYHVTSQRISCARCHGTGYDVANKTVNPATHQDGRVQLASSLRWSSANRSCSPGCHGTKSWSGSSSDGGGGHEGSSGDDIVIVDDGQPQAAGGCGSTGGAFTVMVFAGLAAAILRRRTSRA